MHVTSLRVRYAETDQMGVVHHANYLIYFEAGRSDFLRVRGGVSYAELERQGVRLAVTEAALRWRAPAHYDEEIEVETRLAEAGGVRLRFSYRVRDKARRGVLAEGHTVLASIDAAGRPRRLPAGLRHRFERLVAPEGTGA